MLIVTSSCSDEWLDEKQNIKLIVPTTLNDLDFLMNSNQLEYDGRGASEMSSDEAEYSSEQFNALPLAFQRSLATWTVTEFEQLGQNQDEWDISYSHIQICNIVLTALAKTERTEENKKIYDRIKGTALYHRSRQFLNLAMTFCKYYDPVSAPNELGIPLKLTEDIDEPIFRANLEETYKRIIEDLTSACQLLPIEQISQAHIVKGGAYGLLARAYLYMDQYEQARIAADSSFKYHSFIENYNDLDASLTRPLNIQSEEMHIRLVPRLSISYATNGRINQELYNSYHDNDLRKVMFFRAEADGKFSFKGHYMPALFTGTTTAEVLLISAECKARLGDIDGAMGSLNLLLEKRFETGTLTPVYPQTQLEALSIILLERRKELLTRGLRWQDLKRLNRDPQHAKTLTRIIGSETFTLPPNDPRYILPIPQYIINYNGIQQNTYSNGN